MAYGTRYRRKRSRMSKRTRKTGLSYRKRYTRKSKFGRTGYFRITRWSTLSTSDNCHLSIAGSDLVPNPDGTTTFALNNVAGFTELQNLFDNYRIMKVLYRWVITRDPTSDNTSLANRGLFPRIVWAHDFNDAGVVNRTGLYQRAGLREVYMSETMQKTRWYTLNPAVQSRLFESTVSDSFTPKWRQWIDTGEPGCPHYGIKYAIDQNYTGQIVRLEAKLIMECKGIS